MKRTNLPFLQKERTRHGKVIFYYRRDRGKKIRIHGEFGSDTFMENYHKAATGFSVDTPVGEKQKNENLHTIKWLITEYQQTQDWLNFSAATRKQRGAIYNQILASVGDKPVSALNRESIIAGRDKRADGYKKPDGTVVPPAGHQSRHFLDALRGLFRWAYSSNKVKVDPTEGVANRKRNRSATGFEPWTKADVKKFRDRWPAGTKESVWLAVLIFTGTRRGDAVRLGPPMVEDGILSFTTEKSGHTVPVTLKVLKPLADAIEAGKSGTETWIVGEAGKPLTKESFGNMFRDACNEAGVSKSAHGLRKFAASTAAENGTNIQALDAIFGWTNGQMASHYTKAADRKKMALANAENLIGG